MIAKKVCIKCNALKPITEFYLHKNMADGYMGKCKACKRLDSIKEFSRKMKDPSRRELEMVRQRVKERVARAAKKRKRKSPEELQAQQLRYRARHPEKYKAHQAVRVAVRSGELTKQPCEICGDRKAQAHHDDYSKPLDVRWLCIRHHNHVHNILRATERFIPIAG